MKPISNIKSIKRNYTCVRLNDDVQALMIDYCKSRNIKKSAFIRKCIIKELRPDVK